MENKYMPVDDYQVQDGGYGRVYAVRRKSDANAPLLACKEIRFRSDLYQTKENFRTRIDREVNVLANLDHPNIIQFHDSERIGDSLVNIYTEWLPDIDLKTYVANHMEVNWPPSPEIWSFIYQVSAALRYCHYGIFRIQRTRKVFTVTVPDQFEILHRDIKPGNILVDRKHSDQIVFKLCDFGLGVIRAPTASQPSYGGTVPYIAPEVTRDNPDWSPLADMFSFGCTLFWFISRKHPWEFQLTNDPIPTKEKLPPTTTEAIEKLVYRCIKYSPGDRHTAKETYELASKNAVDQDRLLDLVPTSNPNDDDPRPETPRLKVTPASAPSTMLAAPISAQPSETFPLSATDHQASAFPQSTESMPEPRNGPPQVIENVLNELSPPMLDMNDDVIKNVEKWIGSLITDYKQHPPRDIMVLERSKDIVRTLDDSDFMYSNSIGSDSNGTDSNDQVAMTLKAKRCYEFSLQNSEAYIDDLFSTVFENTDGPISHIPRWIIKKRHAGVPQYVIVGYSVYFNTQIEEKSPGESKSRVKPGYSIRSIYVQRIIGAQWTDFDGLGNVEEAVFWGPPTKALASAKW
ncbi:G2-specific serine/threonine protein kinase [Sticta canariensis]|nr:G2-specific serine/threonine protein kinase [Sticta canariensis]